MSLILKLIFQTFPQNSHSHSRLNKGHSRRCLEYLYVIHDPFALKLVNTKLPALGPFKIFTNQNGYMTLKFSNQTSRNGNICVSDNKAKSFPKHTAVRCWHCFQLWDSIKKWPGKNCLAYPQIGVIWTLLRTCMASNLYRPITSTNWFCRLLISGPRGRFRVFM